MSDQNATLQLPKDLINAVISAEIQKSIAQALSDQRIFVSAVSSVLNQRVDEHGRPCTYSSAIPYVQFAVTKALQEAVKDVIGSEVSQYKELLKSMLATELGKKNSPMLKHFVEAMAAGFVETTKNSYKINVSVESNR